MSFSDPNNVLEESRTLFLLTGSLGLRAFGPRRHRWLSRLYAVLLAGFYCFLFLTIRERARSHYEKYQDVIYYLKLDEKLASLVHLIVVPAIILSSVSKSSDNYAAYKIIEEVDRGLYYLNSPIDHKLEMKKEVTRLSIYVSVVIAANLITYFGVVNNDGGYVFDVSWILNHAVPVFIQILTLCAFHIFVGKILVRFERINRVVWNLVAQGKRVSVVLVHSMDVTNAAKLRLARRIHLQLHDAASAINRAYGSRLFFVFFATLISAFTNFRRSLDLLDDFRQLLDLALHLIWVCFDVGKYFHLANTCRSAAAEAKLPAKFFLETSVARGPNGLADEVDVFFRQVNNKELDLTVLTIFSIDLPKGLTIIIGTLIYILLLG